MKTNENILCVMATCSNTSIVQDQIQSILWGIDNPISIVIVNDGPHEIKFSNERVHVILPKGKIHEAGKVGFKVNEGISWAIENKIEFDWVMILDDDALLLRKGIEKFVSDKFKDKKIGMIAVKDDNLAISKYKDQQKTDKYREFVEKWTNIKEFTMPEDFAFYAVNFQSYNLVKCFYENGLLDHTKEIWPFPCETFQTIFTTLLGFGIYYHGQYPYNLIPPLYVMHHGSVRPKDPRKISNEFLIHHSIKKIIGTKEEEIRRHYKKLRKTIY